MGEIPDPTPLPRQHELKCWPTYFQAIASGRNTFEYRVDDRGFAEGDLVVLREWDPETEQYTGFVRIFTIGYVLVVPGTADTPHVVFSLFPVQRSK
jgi:hypothetical protein